MSGGKERGSISGKRKVKCEVLNCYISAYLPYNN